MVNKVQVHFGSIMEAPMAEGMLQPAKLVASSRHGRGNPLCVGIRSDIYERAFGKDAKDNEILGLQLAEPESSQTGSCRLLVSCAPQPLSLDLVPKGSVKENKNVVNLYCTKEFLIHYQCKNNQRVTLCFIREPPVLQEVVLEARTEKAFNWVNSETFSVAALAGVCKARLLARQGDVLLFPPLPQLHDDPLQQSELSLDVQAVSCRPVIQGVLSVNTAITIIRNFRSVHEADAEAHQGPSPVAISPLIISDFALHKTDYCQNHVCPDQVLLNINIVQYNILTLLPLDVQIIDENNTIFINLKTAKKHGIFDKSYTIVRLQTCDGNQEICCTGANKCERESASDLNNAESQMSNDQFRYAWIRVLKKKRLEVDTVYMNHNLYFNLLPQTSAHDILSRYKLAIQRPTSTHVGSTSSCISQTLPTASELHLTLIHSPNYSLSVRCDRQLKNYFQIQRLVSVGDILCLPAEEEPSTGATLGASSSSSVVYFKVKKVLPSHGKSVTWIVNANTTSVFQDGSIHSYIPIPPNPFFGHEMPPGLDKYHRDLCDLVLPQISSGIDEEMAPATLITGPAGCGKSSLVHSMARQLNLHIVTENCHNLCGETSGATEARIKAAFLQAQSCAPCVLLLLNIDALGKDRDGLGEDPRVAHNFVDVTKTTRKDDTWPVVTMATAKSTKDVSADIISVFLHQITIEVPDEEIRATMFNNLLKRTPCSPDVNIRYLAQRTAGMVLGDLKALISHATREAMNRVLTACSADESGHMTWEQEESISMAGIVVQQCDFQRALDNLQGAQSDAMGAPKIPNVTWADVGGLADVKSEILDTIQLPLQHPELLAAGLRRSGVLLYGPPGTGKTLLAKAVATECSLNFLSVKGPELINMYVGQSEENVREVFKRARNATPCVIFFDELDSLAPNRGRSGDSGGVMDRVVSQLLAELDGMQKSCDVFVIGATNRPDLLDPALLRPGRFDKLLYLSVSEDRQSQLRILQALTRKFTLSGSDVCDSVVEKCPFNLTGADFYALCSDAMLNALKRKIDQLEAGEDVDQTNVVVTEEDFDKALDSLVPSVSEAQLTHYKSLKYSFKGP